MAHPRRTSSSPHTAKRTTARKHRPSLPLLAVVVLSASAASAVVATQSSSSAGRAASWPRGFDGARESFLETVLEANVSNQKSCKPTGLIQDACCDYQTVEDVNEEMASRLGELIKLPFFRYQKVDLFRECPFWQEDGSCMNRACAVQETEEADIPEAWRSGTLGQVKEAVEYPKSLEGALFRDEDFCVCDEASPDSEGVYVDLYENPERFTGYAGASANKVWKAIYEENCFDVVPFITPSRSSEAGGSGYIGTSLLQGAGKNVKTLIGNLGLAAPKDPQDDEQCLEKRVYYRLISGLHASISIHICAEYLDQSTGEWRPNLECFITRIAEHPERLQNVYFDYVLMLRALRKATPYLRAYNYDTGDKEVDSQTHRAVEALLSKAEACSATFDETSMFSGPEADNLKEEFKHHFRNVSRIMDCVGCDKCRLWGKTQVTGLATGLKFLFSFDNDDKDENVNTVALAGTSSSKRNDDNNKFNLRRSEIVAFIWTLNRFSESLAAVEEFRKMWAERNKASPKEQQAIAQGEYQAFNQDYIAPMPGQDGIPGPFAFQPDQSIDETPEQDESPDADADTDADAVVTSAETVRSVRSEQAESNVSMPGLQAKLATTSLGPILHGFFERLVDACRSSIVACFALVERGLAVISGALSEQKSEL